MPGAASAAERVQAVTRALSDLCERNPHVAAGANVALLGSDPDVERLRLRIGGEFVTRFEAALGESSTPELVDALVLAFSGALLQAGHGPDHVRRARRPARHGRRHDPGRQPMTLTD